MSKTIQGDSINLKYRPILCMHQLQKLFLRAVFRRY